MIEGNDLKELQKKISEKRREIDENKKSQSRIQKNPKASLAIASIIFAALVIGMIATFGGIGMIDGLMLGKVVLAGLTAGTGIYMADKITGGKLSNKLDDLLGNSDENQLNQLKKSERQRSRQDTAHFLEDNERSMHEREIKRLIGQNKIKIGDNGSIIERPKESKFSNEDIQRVVKALSTDKQGENYKSALAVSLGHAGTDFDNKDNVKKLLEMDNSYFDQAVDATDKNKLKSIFKVALGVNDEGEKDINNSNAISAVDRATILKELDKAVKDANGGTKINKDKIDELDGRLSKMKEEKKQQQGDIKAVGR